MLVNSFVVLQLGKYCTKSSVSKILLNEIVEMLNVNEIVVFGSRKNDHEFSSKKTQNVSYDSHLAVTNLALFVTKLKLTKNFKIKLN